MFRHHRPHPHVHVIGWYPEGWRGAHALRRTMFGGALILGGAGLLLRHQGLITREELWLVVPLLVALSGVVRLVLAPDLYSLGRALLRLAIAAYLVAVIENLGGWTFAATWPVLLIGGGVAMVAHALFGRRRVEPNW